MEIINESFTLAAIYHFIVLSDIYDYNDVKYNLGWSINALLIL